jgi:hypothetical protein
VGLDLFPDILIGVGSIVTSPESRFHGSTLGLSDQHPKDEGFKGSGEKIACHERAPLEVNT